MDSENLPGISYKDYTSLSERVKALEKFEEQTVRGLSERDSDIDSKFKSMEQKMSDQHKEIMSLITTQISSVKKEIQDDVSKSHEELKSGQLAIESGLEGIMHTIESSRGFVKGVVWVGGGAMALITGFTWFLDHADTLTKFIK